MVLQTWSDIGRVMIVAVAIYPILVAMLRLSGKRTLSKMNAFDFVVTIALGSTLATILLSRDVSLLEGVVALILLVALQLVATWLSVRFAKVRRVLKSEPTLLVRDGHLLHDSMRTQRVTHEEILQAVRLQGSGDLAQIAAVVLETDGRFSVISRSQAGELTALESVKGFQR
jgi:uncharacterized membrane protein YcaP (DUF421 family)